MEMTEHSLTCLESCQMKLQKLVLERLKPFLHDVPQDATPPPIVISSIAAQRVKHGGRAQ